MRFICQLATPLLCLHYFFSADDNAAAAEEGCGVEGRKVKVIQNGLTDWLYVSNPVHSTRREAR